MAERLYRAYADTDSEFDSESDTDTGFSADESVLDLTQNAYVDLNYLTNLPGTKTPVKGGYVASPTEQPPPPADSGTTMKFKPIENTSLFTLNSRDRDTKAYPLPTFFTLRLPRVYKNVKSISLIQLNLLNSFFNFSAAQSNTSMPVYEEGRFQQDGTSNVVKVVIRDGTYTANELVTELNFAMNATPIFKNVSFTQFFSEYQLNGSYAPLFNTPGPFVFNSLIQTYQSNLSLQNVIEWYFQPTQNQGGLNFTYNQGQVAYYYPVIKERYLDPTLLPRDMLSSDGLPPPPGFSTWYEYVVFGFQGINDPNILALINVQGNTDLMNTFRYQHTFATFLVNQYNCTYNAQQGRLNIRAPSLNQSIANDLNQAYSNFLNSNIQNYPQFGDIFAFQNGYSNLQNSNSVLISFYNWFQNRFTLNFGINFGTYGSEFYANPNNQIQLYNIANEFGWSLALTPGVSLSTINANPLPQQSSNFWPNLEVSKNNPDTANFVSTINPSSFTNGVLSFSNAGETQLGYTDISYSVFPMSYVRTTFTSPCRQSIGMMTLPRYINERSPGTQEVYDLNLSNLTPPMLFDTRLYPFNQTSYCLLDVSGNTLFNMYIVEQNMFHEAQYMRAYDQWVNYMYVDIVGGTRIQPSNPNYGKNPPTGDIFLSSYEPYIFFQMNADQYPIEPDALFDVTFYVETTDDQNFITPLVITWYKDRAGFMADALPAVSGQNPNTETPRNYFQTQTYANTNSATMIVSVRNLQQTYFYVHYDTANQAGTNSLRVFCVLTNTYGQYTRATQDDKLDMPYNIVNTQYDPFNPNSAIFFPTLISIYSTSVTTLGYDISGVSNNLLDYFIQTPGLNFYDPTNLRNYSLASTTLTGLQYQFNLSNVGAPQPKPDLAPPWSVYFGPVTPPGTNPNLIMNLYKNNIYLSTGQKQTFSPTNFPNEAIVGSMMDYNNPTIKEIYLNPAQDPYMTINSTTIFQNCINTSVSLVTDASTCYAFQDISGTKGVGFFLPTDTILEMQQMVLKFAYVSPSSIPISQFGSQNINRVNSPFSLWGNDLQEGVFNGASYNMQGNLAADTDNPLEFLTPVCSGPSVPVATSTLYEVQVNYPSFAASLNYLDSSTMTSLANYIQNQNPGNMVMGISAQPIGVYYTFPVTGITSNTSNYTFYNSNMTKPRLPYFISSQQLAYTFFRDVENVQGQWDDWYLYNRVNTKIGIYPTSYIQQQTINDLRLDTALYTMTLTNVSQAVTYTNVLGTLKTREPDWGTFYQYKVQPTSTLLWTPLGTSYSSFFSTMVVPADIVPTFYDANDTYPGYMQTNPQIYNNVYLPRSYGLASGVGNAVSNPYPGISSYTADIPNSYMAVPFYYDLPAQTWKVGSFYGLAFSREPAVPSTGLVGAAPYFGPPGIFNWTTSTNQFGLTNGDQQTFQPDYWNAKSGFTILNNITYNPATDLADFGELQGLSGEYQDTMMYFYTNSTIGQDYNDISGASNHWIWGQESNRNYTTFNDQSGWNFLSYLNRISVRSSVPQYAVHVRAYDPIPQFVTGLRIIGNNYTDFGLPTLGEIASEISSLSGYQYITEMQGSIYLLSTQAFNAVISTNNSLRLNNGYNRYSHAYADALTIFNDSMMVSSITFGGNAGFAGQSFSFQGYADAFSQYQVYYSTTTGLYQTYTTIFSTTTTAMDNYVTQVYGDILPSSILSRSQYTAPLPFQLLFRYDLKEPYLSQFDEWGLGWYLGFPKANVPLAGPRTYVTSDTFIRIVQNYIYLKLNPAFNINTIAVSGKENLSETRESQGQDVQYFTKILTNNFGDYCRAGVQLQKDFEPVIGKYEIISCQLVDKNGIQITNDDCDFDLTIGITELTNGPDDRSAMVSPEGALDVYKQKIFGLPNK